ncbi:MAG: hypothetical protein AAGG38_14420 [Planctomycetota bacterium]
MSNVLIRRRVPGQPRGAGWAGVAVAIGLVLGVGGCADLGTVNPSFAVTHAEADRRIDAMGREKKALSRPVVFVGPFLDPLVAECLMVSRVRRVVADPSRVTGVSFVGWDTFEICRAKTLRAVEAAFGAGEGGETVEVDVIGFSMGGLVARYAAMAPDAARGQTGRLKIRRLYTIATPHRGAAWAPLGVFNSLAQGMEAGSGFLERLDAGLAEADYELIPYTRLGDVVVGPSNTSPAGMTPWWVPGRALEFAHVQAVSDPRIVADILADLRGEERLTEGEPAALPAFARGGER